MAEQRCKKCGGIIGPTKDDIMDMATPVTLDKDYQTKKEKKCKCPENQTKHQQA